MDSAQVNVPYDKDLPVALLYASVLTWPSQGPLAFDTVETRNRGIGIHSSPKPIPGRSNIFVKLSFFVIIICFHKIFGLLKQFVYVIGLRLRLAAEE
jgi:hypothetical protein